MTGCCSAGALAVGAKTAAPVLVIWTVVVITYLAFCRPNFRANMREASKPSAPVVTLLVLAGYAALSALWARDPQAAIAAGVTFAGVILVGQLLHWGLKQLTPAVSILVAGWFTIGLIAGGLMLISQFLTDFAIFRWILGTVPNLQPIGNSMVVQQNGQWILTSISIGNWSVAAVSMVMWPGILAVVSVAGTRNRAYLAISLFALVTSIALISDHQTSQFGLLVSLGVFAAAWAAPAFVKHTVAASCMFLIIAVVPLSYAADRVFKLHDASWAQPSLKERFRIWGSVAEHYTKAPIFGIGANNTTNVETSYPVPFEGTSPITTHHPHDMILQIWLELGAVGGALLLVAGYQVFRVVNRVPPAVVPYVLATVVLIAIEAIATWNLWSTWFLSALAITMTFLLLGVRVAEDAGKATSPAFFEIWLPQSFSAWWPDRSKSRSRV